MSEQVYVSTGSGGTWSTSIVGKDTTSTTQSRPTISSTSATSTSNPYLLFNCSVPSGVTVTAISVSVKMRASQSNRSASVRLYNGTTSISNTNTVTSTSTSNIATFSATSIPTSFTNLRLYFSASSTNSNYRPYVYGATITITYTVPAKTVTYTVVGEGTVVQTPSGTSIATGTDINYLITTNNPITSVTDNNINVTAQVKPHTEIVVERSIADSDFALTQRGTASYGFTKQSAALTYASNLTGNSERAGCTRFTTNFQYDTTITLAIKWNTANSGDYVYIGNFDTSLSTSTTRPSSGTYQYNHTGTTTQFTYTMTVPAGSHYFDLYHYHAKANSSRTCTVVFSGNILSEKVVPGVYDYDIINLQDNHTLVFTFGGSAEQMMIKINGTWTNVSEVYKKIDGVWIKQTNLSDLFNTDVNYQKMN